MRAGQVIDAESAYNAILAEDPHEHRAHLGVADCVSARGLVDWAVDHLVENARLYAEGQHLRGTFALMSRALAIAPSRLDLHIDVAEFEALDGHPELAALRLENLARTYVAIGQEQEAELVLEAAAAFRTLPEQDGFAEEPEPAPFINMGAHAEPRSHTPRVAATPPPPPPTSRATATPRPVAPTPTPVMVRPTPHQRAASPPPPPPSAERITIVVTEPMPPKPKRTTRGRSGGDAPKWRPSTIRDEPARRRVLPQRVAPKAAANKPTPKRPSLVLAPSPKRGGKKLDKLPSLKPLPSQNQASHAPPGKEDRTAMWRPRPSPTVS